MDDGFGLVSMLTDNFWLSMSNFSSIGQYLGTQIVKMLRITPNCEISIQIQIASIVA